MAPNPGVICSGRGFGAPGRCRGRPFTMADQPMTPSPLDRGRELFEREAWGEAFTCLEQAGQATALGPEELDRLAVAAYLTARDAESDAYWERAHQEFLRTGDAPRAARCAFWLGIALMDRGEMAPSNGWLARAQRVIDDGQLDCAEQGYLMIPGALQSMGEGDAAAAYAAFSQASKTGERFHDPDLITMARLGRGHALLQLGEIAEGVALLDEAMVSVTAGEVSPIVVGTAYCAMIDACSVVCDLRRAREWTSALTAWCEAHPDLVPFRGQCLVHRAEILLLQGRWPEALVEARRAGELLSQPEPRPALGDALYQQAELHRLRGELETAEAGYRDANRWGRTPYPGLARLRLAQGRLEEAAASVRRVMAETQSPVARTGILSAFVEIMVAAQDVGAARAGAEELSGIAAEMGSPLLHAAADHAHGAVLLAERDVATACAVLRRAAIAWRDLGAPYEAARSRLLVGIACRALGDHDTAGLEIDAARACFAELGAATDRERLERLERLEMRSGSGRPGSASPSRGTDTSGLTPREREVLALVATGRTNRAIAAELVLSEKTVARHLSNIFTKLDLSSRSAATAYAYEHGLVP